MKYWKIFKNIWEICSLNMVYSPLVLSLATEVISSIWFPNSSMFDLAIFQLNLTSPFVLIVLFVQGIYRKKKKLLLAKWTQRMKKKNENLKKPSMYEKFPSFLFLPRVGFTIWVWGGYGLGLDVCRRLQIGTIIVSKAYFPFW